MWYDPIKTLSYNCILNFIIGNRGGGKTFGCVEWCIKDFKRRGAQFIYLRRYGTEFENIKAFFKSQKKIKFPEIEFEVTGSEEKGGEFIINGECAGYYIALSTAAKLKSIDYSEVYNIIYDEFLIDKGMYHYLPHEVRAMLNFYETVARLREGVRMFFLANAITFTNDYFIAFDLHYPRNNSKVYVNRERGCLVQLVEDEEFIKAKNKTSFGKLIAGTEFAEYSINNKSLQDNLDFVERKTDGARFCFAFVYDGFNYGVWLDYTVGKFWVSMNVDPSNKIVYALTLDDHKPNTMLLQKARQSAWLRPFVDSYRLGNVYFESMRIKNVTMKAIKLLIM